MKKHKGWIAAYESDGPYLESLGIELGEYEPDFEGKKGRFIDCIVPEEALDKLSPCWVPYCNLNI